MECYHEKIAGILKVDPSAVEILEKKLENLTGKTGVLRDIADDNEKKLVDRLFILGVTRDASAQEVYDALISKVEADDLKILKHIWAMGDGGASFIEKTVFLIKNAYPTKKGFFLKKDRAKELLVAEPPKNILRLLGYDTVQDMLQHEDLLEVYSALRFLEDSKWQNEVFFKQYEKLTPDDFEERYIEIKVLNKKWAEAAERFVKKKYHNISHLKELGLVFIIPIFLGISGETLRTISLIFHYCYEIKFYSDLFMRFSGEDNFSMKIISLLRGDVIDRKLPPLKSDTRGRFLVIQRYLAKDDENDWRLFEPRINTEAIHWKKAETEVVDLSKKMLNFNGDLEFWRGIGSIGDYFRDEKDGKILMSFNIVDITMSLIGRRDLIKYLYHQREAMWNKIFSGYFSFEEMEKYAKDNLLKGYFEV